jgi:biotin-(acetyl-CoA carboxylase) ligase
MPLGQHRRIKTPPLPALDLPPPFRLVTLREAGDAFRHACARAGELGAGTLVVVGRFDLAEFAVVLEPDEPLADARRVFFAGMTALVDALSAIAPPRKPIAIQWPGTVLVDGGLVGGGRLGWPAGTKEKAVPEWLVFGAMIRTVSMTGVEGGLYSLSTALEDEGFDAARSDRLVEGFARHFMSAIDRWRDAGFASVGVEYVARLRPDDELRYDLDECGALLVRRPARPIQRHALRPALETASWLDPESGGPRR